MKDIDPRSRYVLTRADDDGVPCFVQWVSFDQLSMGIDVYLFDGSRVFMPLEHFSFDRHVDLLATQPPPGWQEDAMKEAEKILLPEFPNRR